MTTYLNSFTSTKIGGRRRIGIAAAILAAFCFTSVSAQAPVAPSSASAPQSAGELENLVGKIALYPDDLIAVILPASTFPLQIVQADRYLDKRKADPKLKYDEGWDDSVKTLLNYPEIIKTMSGDLDWTSDLGEAVVADQGEVLAAIQTFRRKTQAAGNLKSDSKQVVIVEKEVIKIVPADPQVIYVPQYNPTTVVVYGGYTSYGYYPAPYPSYYYPYPPGAALATGIIFGAAIGAAWSGNHYGWNGNNDININRNTNINTGNINNGNINRGNSAGNTSNWKSNKQPGQVGNSVGKTSSTRGAGYGSGGSAGGARASQGGASAGNMGGRGTGAGNSAASQNLSGMGSAGSANRSAGGGNSSFGGYGSGRQTGMDSSRGASSRGSMSGGGGRSMGGGGGRSMGGGGGRGGGGRR